jgi:hypothetical protein
VKVWNIRDLIIKAGPIVTSNLLFLHAWTGCNTTSATFGQGKLALMKKLKQSAEIHELASIINDEEADSGRVGEAGCKLFVIIYGGKKNDSLSNLRYVKYMQMVTTSKKIEPHKLPPTARAAYFHSLRVHLQVVIWKTPSVHLPAIQWGKTENTLLYPIMTNMEGLLKFIRCKCKLSTCNSNVCSCHKHGLKCVSACGDCHGKDCRNIEIEEIIYEEDQDDIL